MEGIYYIVKMTAVLGVTSFFVTTVGAQTKCSEAKHDLPHVCQHITLRQPTGLLVTGGDQSTGNCSCRVIPKNSTDQDVALSVTPLHPESSRRLYEATCNLRINIFRHTRRRNGTSCPIFSQKYAINSGNPITVEFMHDKSKPQTEYCVHYSIPTSRVNEVEIVCNNGTIPFEGIANPGEEDVSILESKAFIIGVSVAGGILLLLIIIIIVITCRRKSQHRDDCVMTRYEPSNSKDRTSPDRGVTVVPLLKYNAMPDHMDHGPVPTPRTTSLGNSSKDYPIVPQESQKVNQQLQRYPSIKADQNDHTQIPIVLASPGRDPSDPSGKRMTYLEVDVSQVSPGAIKVKVRGAPPKTDHPQIGYKN
ncbi:uncharacterized protein LOC135479719 [Liolophura sinensis]|uniref:uncharacterized protein LOC135479719 n=1 Tax=Liolophura sinensis TaxID=3198878 RepID=UPI003158780B